MENCKVTLTLVRVPVLSNKLHLNVEAELLGHLLRIREIPVQISASPDLDCP